ncbi:MAG: alanine--tRNA ligase [Actinomycetota bacterium]
MEGRRIRETFLSFFEQRGHKRVPSSSLIPPAESGLLLTNAGMNQFIPYFLGHAPAPFPRATTVQKCFRAVDIDLVGLTARHLSMFEMLGNFSFADYFKPEACAWAFELVTEGFGIDADRLWVTVFETDDEAIDVWADEVGVPRARIVRRGKTDNFWWTHAAGPAGPCSEIYVDRGPKYGPEGGPAVDEERFMEIWNLVFMQNEVDGNGDVLSELPGKNIDTGSSLERVATVLRGFDSFYETDLMRPLVEVAEEISGKHYGADERADVSLRIVAEHGRATTFLIADGVLPSNEGRGYVLRRELRSVVSHARRLGIKGTVMDRLVETTAQMFGDAYPELVQNRAFIEQVAGSEEERFAGTLRQGMVLFEAEAEKTKPGGTLPGDLAFRLHDTHGFPVELTTELAADLGLSIDADRFAVLMEEQRRRAKAAVKRGGLDEAVAEIATTSGKTEFVGYGSTEADGRIVALLSAAGRSELAGEGEEVRLVLDRTPFYAESGGQVGDEGILRTSGGAVRITDAQWGPGDVIVHTGVVESGEIRGGQEARLEVDAARRESTARSHTATHVVHWTLRHVLGDHARQAGSLVAPGRLRFDFPHHSAVPADVLEEAEELANRRLAEDSPITIYETTFDYAKTQGAIALFGEKYGDIVRVVEVGDYSVELCGGTHVPRTGNVAVVRIVHEGSIGAGLRRVEALVGPDALKEANVERRLLDEVVVALGGGDPRGAPERARRAVERIKRLESELGRLRKGDREALVESLAGAASQVDGVALVVSEVPGEDAEGLRELALALRMRLEKAGAGAAVLGNADGGNALLVASCTGPLVERGVTASELLGPAAKAIGGGAGGKPILAFAGGRNAAAFGDALGGVPARLSELLANH